MRVEMHSWRFLEREEGTLRGLLNRPELVETAVVIGTVEQVGLRPDRVTSKATGM